MKNQKALLSFEFASSNGEIKPLTFSDPLKVISTYSLDEVLPKFQLIQEAINEGYYVAGFLSYESAPAFDSAFKVKSHNTMPLLWFGVFSEPQHEAITSHHSYSVTPWQSSVEMEEYNSSIKSIKHSIEMGNTYQTNYTIRLQSQFSGDDIAYFNTLKKAQSSNYCAYIRTEDHRILSASPELFFHLEGNQITTRPMKGTIKRGNSFEEDEAKSSWLYHSEKNRAENVMIVDLLRNDLGMIAKPGSVQVPKLFEIEKYPTVHQMTSTVTAEIRKKIEIVDIFQALFPCGSITGAPKISTMGIIADLESSPREVYCGAIGYITPNKEAIFNVPIRTVMIDQTGKAIYGVGGGITWDSTAKSEYHEVLAKAHFLQDQPPEFKLLESLLLEDGQYFLLEEHIHRMKNSAFYFGFPFHEEGIMKAFNEFSIQHTQGILKVRFLLSKNGDIHLEGQSISKMKSPLPFILADQPIDKNKPFLYHKTTNREIYSRFQIKKPTHIFDILLWNTDGELTEFTNGNLVLEIDGTLWTPDVKSGLLAGTFREHLLKTGEIHERVLTMEDLNKSTKVWFINSVRKWIEVEKATT